MKCFHYFVFSFLLLLICFPSSTLAQSSSCGAIIDEDGTVTEIENCANPFGASIEDVPISITLEGQNVTPATTISIDNLAWGVFSIENHEEYEVALYKRDGDNLRFVRKLPDDVDDYFDQAAIDTLEYKFYFIEKGLDTNLSELLRTNPESIGSEEYTYISEFYFEYSQFSYLFEDEIYVLVLTTSEELDDPVVSWGERLRGLIVSTVYAQSSEEVVYAIPFLAEVTDELPSPVPTCTLDSADTSIQQGESVMLSWDTHYTTSVSILPDVGTVPGDGSFSVSPSETTEYTLTANGDGGEVICTAAVSVTVAPELSLHEQAAALAKELVDNPDAYLWGGKGWDYDLAEFTSPARILDGYTYYNPDAGRKEVGVGVDCSGLITWAFNRSFDATSGFLDNFVQYVNADGLSRDFQSDVVSEADLAPGDAMFFDWDDDGYMDHVAMYVGDSGGYDVVNSRSLDFGIVTEQKSLYKTASGFTGFRRIHKADIAMTISTGSPVDILVTDPEGVSITPQSTIPSEEEYVREIPGELYYLEIEKGHDGNPIDHVIIPTKKPGTYTVSVTPSENAASHDTYSLSIAIGGEVVVLADNLPIENSKTTTYQVVVGETEAVSVATNVVIDIYPERKNNVAQKPGIVPVIIFSNDEFDAATVLSKKVRLAGAKPYKKSYAFDVNGDNLDDLLLFFKLKQFKDLVEGDNNLTLTGETDDGILVVGNDALRVHDTVRMLKRWRTTRPNQFIESEIENLQH